MVSFNRNSDNVCFKAGRLKKFAKIWTELTSDDTILEIAFNCRIQFYDDIQPIRPKYRPTVFSDLEKQKIREEINNMLSMEIIEEVEPSENQFISSIFTVPKKDGQLRMILNLKDLNNYVEYHHFKMDTFETALKLIKPHCFMASIDIKNAYYSIPMANEYRKFLRFFWDNKFFQYTCLPFGLSSAPRYFTKLLKPIFSTLRRMGHAISGYIDDSLLVGDTYQECTENVIDTKWLFEKTGFIVNEKKSVFQPVQKLQFLGFFIDSFNMIVTLPHEKVEKVISECSALYNKSSATLTDIARVIGILVSVFPAVEQGQLHYRVLEHEKITGLKKHYGDFNAKIPITYDMKSELKWWIENIKCQYRKIDHGDPQLVITTDASMIGWGAVCDNTRIGGRWNDSEILFHINYLELLAVWNAIKSFCKNKSNLTVSLRIDNTCAIAYINNMGGIKSPDCNILARKIWNWCIEKHIWLTASYVPTSENIADIESRRFNENIEWMLCPDVFQLLTKKWGIPDIDLFATRLNKQLPIYASWKPDPESKFIDAFSLSWSNLYCYVFPPFSLLGRTIGKILRDKTKCIVIAPIWPTQTWYTELLKLLIDNPILLPLTDNLLTLSQTDKVHPLHKKLRLMACLVSGNLIDVENFLLQQPESLWHHGVMEQRDSIPHTFTNGFVSVVRRKLITFTAL